MLKRTCVAAALSFTFAGCVLESQTDFDAKPFEVSANVSRNYQAAFADVTRGARMCWGVGPSITALPQGLQLEAQLYPDLGYAEVYSYAAGTVFMPQALVRIERTPNGAKVSVKTGPMAGGVELFRNPAIEWAKGNVTCGRA